MATSRREFLIGLAASGATATLPSQQYAGVSILSPLPNPAFIGRSNHQSVDIKIGYSAIAWQDQDTLAIQDLSALGFPGIQLRANVIVKISDPHVLRDMLAQHHLRVL